MRHIEAWRKSLIAVAAAMAMGTLPGCVAVGYSSNGGWFMWPRELAVVAVILFVVLLLRRRR